MHQKWSTTTKTRTLKKMSVAIVIENSQSVHVHSWLCGNKFAATCVIRAEVIDTTTELWYYQSIAGANVKRFFLDQTQSITEPCYEASSLWWLCPNATMIPPPHKMKRKSSPHTKKCFYVCIVWSIKCSANYSAKASKNEVMARCYV